ncbi:uncharacterized protein CTHT_0058500 [Thermochaetoides thermophila DSM 1495]|uniref:Uncharacterized protein n=1 Tax=Chaetomium thermophilum (strain DSM 1495 / CBS 144.50 / IMI 039719) TaxID=759272 RepID=G0SCV4_CHATD|nr:hypothetical protein CTHT_0058500 [Thermochaetoides thermophila DSM 1495]EGS19225.1 hypothetical protein CTHT_0058500 [Thermochaetoides thermophila DSM 1495]
MNAAALLKAQGWRGKGYTLHPTDNSIGLAKPLLISRNTDGRGIGNKAHYTSDQWWLNAFDQKLKGLETSKNGVVQTVKQGKLDAIAPNNQRSGKYTGANGLYASFVRGGMLEGTIQIDSSTKTDSTDATPATSDDSEGSLSRKEKKEETKAEKEARKAAKKLRKAQREAAKKAAEKAALKATRKEAKKEAGKQAKKGTKKARKSMETKEERRARKAERRAKKEAKRRRQLEAAQRTEAG